MEQIHPNKRYAKNRTEAFEAASHGLTKGELQAVHDAQKQGLEIPMMTANKDKSHMIPEHEKYIFHIRTTLRQFNPNKNDMEDIVRFHKTPEAMFEQIMRSHQWDGHKVEILHDPTLVRHTDEDGKYKPKPKAEILGAHDKWL